MMLVSDLIIFHECAQAPDGVVVDGRSTKIDQGQRTGDEAVLRQCQFPAGSLRYM
jgi:hypothetical protein